MNAENQMDPEIHRRLFYLQTLHDVSREIVPLQDVRTILKVSAMTLTGALGSPMAVALVQESGDALPQTAFALGLDAGASAGLVRDVPFADEVSLLGGGRDACHERLRAAGMQVWMGFRLEEGLSAGLGLGPRLSEDPYSGEDLQFLETIRLMVRQALHNAWLYEAQQRASAALEELNRELEIRVQDRTEALSAACEALSREGSAGEFVGESPAMRQVCAQLDQVAATQLTVLLLGETGTGKGLVARLVHQLSPQRSAPFVHVNCGSLPPNLVESELFGHERGAFTGASSSRVGKVELAQGGTLFLDEIGDMPHEAQVKLLRLLEERVFERVGGSRAIDSTARIIAATNRDLEGLVRDSAFREDLYFRLRVFPVHLPPLQGRREDIALLARHAVQAFSRHLNRPAPQISPLVLAQLQEYAWPGNVRELEHLMQRAVLLCRNGRIEAGDVDLAPGPSAAPQAQSAFATLAEREKQHIQQALEATNWVVFGQRGAARLLGINPQTLRYRIKKHGLYRPPDC